MKITVTNEAHKWFMEEMGLETGDAVRFLGKLYGKTEVHDNFSVSMRIDVPEDVLTQTNMDGITYFIEKKDEWFFSGYNFHIEYNEQRDEVDYRFIAQ